MWNNLGSGRLWLTLITGCVFLYCSIKGKINSEAISAIISMVFISYFNKDRGSNGKDTNMVSDGSSKSDAPKV